MKCTIINNGNDSIILAPESEIEKLQLQKIFQGAITVKPLEVVRILDKDIQDVIVISAQKGAKE